MATPQRSFPVATVENVLYALNHSVKVTIRAHSGLAWTICGIHPVGDFTTWRFKVGGYYERTFDTLNGALQHMRAVARHKWAADNDTNIYLCD